jgi:hypothetical protein
MLLRSVDEVVAPYRQLQLLLAIITAGGVLLFALGSGADGPARDDPVALLLRATQRLSRGEYDVPMEHTEAGRNRPAGALVRPHAPGHRRTAKAEIGGWPIGTA